MRELQIDLVLQTAIRIEVHILRGPERMMALLDEIEQAEMDPEK